MELAENLFTSSLARLEKLLAEDFQRLTADIKKIPEKMRQEKAGSCSDLIQLLQYHDLIRQKVQHVQQLNLLFEEEVKRASEQLKYEYITPELFMLMIELLRFSKHEYVKVAKQIKFQFNQLAFSAGWSENNFNLFYEETLSLLYRMEILYIKVGEHHKKNALQLIDALEKMQKIYQSFSMESEREIYRSIMKDSPYFKETQKLEGYESGTGTIDLF